MTVPPPDPATVAARLGCSEKAVRLVLESDFVDLHADVEVPVRVFGYRPSRRHRRPRRVRPLVGHLDFPRIREAGLTGVVYDIATNPFRPKKNRLSTTIRNLDRAMARVGSEPALRRVVHDLRGYEQAVSSGRTAYWIAIQGGNAFSADPAILEGPIGTLIHRITLVHLTNSDLGGTSSPLGGDRGLTALGARMVQAMNRAHILVDLAHAGERTFWEALEAHVDDLPPIVSHTGVDGVHPHWRNLTDAQVKAIAERGGVVGIMYQSSFLEPVRWSARRAAIVDHLEHVIRVAGEGTAAIGTDYDGFIVPPRDLLDVTDHPLLVQDMLDRGWTEARIRGVLGGNYLRVVGTIRPG